jgi:hypothetical protein
MSPSTPEAGAAPRTRRPFRILLVLALVLTTIQGVIGGPLAGGAGGGWLTASSTSFGAVLSAILGSSGLLIFHAFEGFMIFLLAIGVAALSFRHGTRNIRVFAVLSLIAVLVALIGGYLHIGGSPAGIPMMSEGYIATYAFLFMTLYCSK